LPRTKNLIDYRDPHSLLRQPKSSASPVASLRPSRMSLVSTLDCLLVLPERLTTMPVTTAELQATVVAHLGNRSVAELRIHDIQPLVELTDSGLLRDTVERLLKVSDEVTALWIGPHPVMFPSAIVLQLCESVEARNRQMRETIASTSRTYRTRPLLRKKNEQQLLDTFGSEPNAMRPFVRVSHRQYTLGNHSLTRRSCSYSWSPLEVDCTLARFRASPS